ncbi:MAG: hypothetical protein EOO50_05180 [Flavobacterium sp.]|uniref:AbiH family protein n=1 Tax=Flavobacterium sp. TaxID=239 RepID=UPI0012070EA3|nr:AbiH family protein [Flavobacterium sp.]RZJ67676.1 MAG: hypothetical protein EOO50_05180 [Flavobacterium sp.]
MNRLVILGNGFDLAHGLPTSYNHFLSWYWKKVNAIAWDGNAFVYEDDFISAKSWSEVPDCLSLADFEKIFNNGENGKHYSYKNAFFIQICQIQNFQNWVDIEEYYKLQLSAAFHQSTNREKQIKTLNEQFGKVRELFGEYLNEVIPNFESENLYQIGMNHILNNWVEGLSFTSAFSESVPHHLKDIEEFQELMAGKRYKEDDGRTMVLNFNYTDTVRQYIRESSKVAVNYIHGHRAHENYPIVFGYGDESDELFPKLEVANENSYLQFTKSASYLTTSNYTNLMNFVESKPFFVQVLGHSMAISDRTLLKTIFEHDNCKYIFMFYHERVDGTTDFFDKSANIARHFSDKKMLRKKVAPKVFCCRLPQKVSNVQ